ncbi:MAG TPA: lmo0937 family membrane protein [Chloroflexota bacterium]|nr:lmo0937 family membrane protein [Chloroflexota bacterium]
MLLALAIILLILWAGGYFAFHLVTAAIHILLLLAVISLILNFVGPWSRRGPVA